MTGVLKEEDIITQTTQTGHSEYENTAKWPPVSWGRDLRRNQTCHHLGGRLPDSRTMRDYISVA